MVGDFVDVDPDEEERWRKEHAEMHAKHRGHDVMHAEMFIVFIVSLIVAQIVLFVWKKKHFKSYQMATLFGLWIIPLIVSFKKDFWRFIVTWIIFTAVTGYIWHLITRPIISGRTPRLVYKYFLFLHKASYVLGIVGYLLLMATLLGINLVFRVRSNTCLDLGVCLLFYGLYYGVLGRDLAHIYTDAVACKIGYFTHEGIPKRVLQNDVCAVCGDSIIVNHSKTSADHLALSGNDDMSENSLSEQRHSFLDELDVVDEKSYTLSCNHIFHEFCIRGWCVVGKMQTCPYCKEKVDLKRMFKNPWEKPHLFYGQLLDWIRYLVAWQPLIVTIVQGVNTYLGLE